VAEIDRRHLISEPQIRENDLQCKQNRPETLSVYFRRNLGGTLSRHLEGDPMRVGPVVQGGPWVGQVVHVQLEPRIVRAFGEIVEPFGVGQGLPVPGLAEDRPRVDL